MATSTDQTRSDSGGFAALAAAAREGEPDRYLAALLAPAPIRADLVALAAALAEIRRIPQLVRDPMMGEIRLQWWRDAFTALANREATGNPVADRLGEAMRRHALPGPVLQALTEARAFDLYSDPMPDRAALAGYLARTEGAAFALGLAVAGVADRGEVSRVGEAAGQAYGLARLLTQLPEWLAAGRMPIPADQLRRSGVAVEDLSVAPPTEPARQVLRDLVHEARLGTRRVRETIAAVAPAARAVLLPVAVIEPYLGAFEKALESSLGRPITILPVKRAWRLWRAHRTWCG